MDRQDRALKMAEDMAVVYARAGEHTRYTVLVKATVFKTPQWVMYRRNIMDGTDLVMWMGKAQRGIANGDFKDYYVICHDSRDPKDYCEKYCELITGGGVE